MERIDAIKARLAAAFYGADGERETASVLAIQGLDAARDDVRWLVAENARLRDALDMARDAALDFALDDDAALARVIAIIDAAYPQGTPAGADGETV